MENQIAELENRIRDLEAKLSEKDSMFNELKDIIQMIKNDYDIENSSFETTKPLNVNRGEFNKFGDSSFLAVRDTVGQRHNMIISTGVDSGSIKNFSKSTDLVIENQDSTNLTTKQSFLHMYRTPLYTNINKSVTSAGTTLTDGAFQWVTNELAGAMLNIYDSSGVQQFSRQIASNTSNTITIDGTFPATVSGCTYIVFMPVYLAGADYPWRRLSVGGDDISSGGDGTIRRAIRFGYGTTGGTETIGLFFGSRTPNETSGGAANGVVANIGSLYLRTDGGAGTTLYVKETTNNNTGWAAK